VHRVDDRSPLPLWADTLITVAATLVVHLGVLIAGVWVIVGWLL
jgi:hypothetical protein